MGLKDAAKALMEKAGVPVVPGYLGEDQAEATLARGRRGIGYPVLIKAVAGGGGKGMRRRRRSAADSTPPSPPRDARRRPPSATTGCCSRNIVTRPRHIEVQVLRRRPRHVVHLFERDCSLQRRHQKVIEEAPGARHRPAARAPHRRGAVKAARAVGYVGAGTVEVHRRGPGDASSSWR